MLADSLLDAAVATADMSVGVREMRFRTVVVRVKSRVCVTEQISLSASGRGRSLAWSGDGQSMGGGS